MDKLIDYLRGKELLVVLDNCEHLIEACAQVAERVLRSAPRTRFLATSRERLGVAGEALLAVPPLGVPGPQELAPGQIAQSEAVQLFADRATAVQPAFVLDEGTAAAVARICRRLDGIPLAIELAAARVRILPPLQIAARLDDRFGLLTSGSRGVLPRHQTLRAAIDWSYGLLAGPERELFGRLSVFAGGFTLEAAEEVCGDEAATGPAVLESLSRLVDQSLVISEDRGPGAFPHARDAAPLRRQSGSRSQRERPRSSSAGTRSTSCGWPSGRSRCSAVPSRRRGCARLSLTATTSAPPWTGRSAAIQTWPCASPAPWRTSG